MAEKKLKIISLSVPPDMHQELKDTAQKLGLSVSHLMRNLVEKYLYLLMNDDNEVRIILKVPAHLREDRDALQEWVKARGDALVEALAK